MDFDHPKYGEVYTTIYLYIYIILNQQGVQPSQTTNFRQGARSYPPPAPGHGHAAHRGALPPARPSGLAPLAPWADADLLPGVGKSEGSALDNSARNSRALFHLSQRSRRRMRLRWSSQPRPIGSTGVRKPGGVIPSTRPCRNAQGHRSKRSVKKKDALPVG